MSKKEERHYQILSLLNENQIIGVVELSEILKCSEATIRNDLRELESRGLIKRTHGGVLSSDYQSGSHQDELKVRKSEKKAIAQYVVNHILQNNHTIVLDVGTTTLALAEEIANSNLQLNIVTNSLETGSILAKNKNLGIIVPGGEYDSYLDTLDTLGTLDFYRKIHADYYFMSCNGIDVEAGYTIPFQKLIATKEIIRQQCTSTIVLADSSKLGKVTTRKICNLTEVDMLITDDQCSESQKKELTKTGLDVRFAPVCESMKGSLYNSIEE